MTSFSYKNTLSMAAFYPLIKHLHMTLAAISVCGFMLRFMWMSQGSPLSEHKLSKVLPHIVDTFLLLGGLALAIVLQQYPFSVSWLSMKLLLLLVYIGFGTMALKRAPTQFSRTLYFVAALLVFAQMVGVVINHNAWGWLA